MGYNHVNPTMNTTMLALDSHDNTLYLYRNGKFYELDQKTSSKIIDKNGKIKPEAIPSQFPTKVWVKDQITKSMVSVFKLKGIKQTQAQIFAIEDAKAGDLWICAQNRKQYVWTNQEYWENLGDGLSIDMQTVRQIIQQCVDQAIGSLVQTVGSLSSAVSQIQQDMSGQSQSLSGLSSSIQEIGSLQTALGQRQEQLEQSLSSVSSSVDTERARALSAQSELSTSIQLSSTQLSQRIEAQEQACHDNLAQYDDGFDVFITDVSGLNQKIDNL